MTFPDTPLTRAALAYATEKHAGQTRWGGQPYIVHPIRVAEKAVALYDEKYTSRAYDDPRSRAVCERERELVAAVSYGHDLAEDVEGLTDRALPDHLHALGLIDQTEWGQIAEALRRLNKHHYPDYLAFTLAARGFYLSRFPKMADISDNLADKAKGSARDKYLVALHILQS